MKSVFSTDPLDAYDSLQVGQFIHGMPLALATVGPVTSLGDELGTKLVKVRHVIPEEEVVCTWMPLVVVKCSYLEVAVCTSQFITDSFIDTSS